MNTEMEHANPLKWGRKYSLWQEAHHGHPETVEEAATAVQIQQEGASVL
jgi:hypothetical protein